MATVQGKTCKWIGLDHIRNLLRILPRDSSAWSQPPFGEHFCHFFQPPFQANLKSKASDSKIKREEVILNKPITQDAGEILLYGKLTAKKATEATEATDVELGQSSTQGQSSSTGQTTTTVIDLSKLLDGDPTWYSLHCSRPGCGSWIYIQKTAQEGYQSWEFSRAAPEEAGITCLAAARPILGRDILSARFAQGVRASMTSSSCSCHMPWER